MRLQLSAQDEAFRQEVRAFLESAFTPELRAQAARQVGVFAEAALALRWQRILYGKGWVAPSWPREYGGTGWSPVQRYVFDTECALLGTPFLPAMGLQMCGPVLLRYGTEAQKQFFLPRMLTGEHYWCQGYSEPGAGSDLASLQCRAVREGDTYIVDGTKIWTTHAQYANWIFMLVRTASSAKPQAGISFLLAPLDSPGINVRPILSMSGEHEINQIFFDGVRVPAANLVGEENGGWGIAKYLLEFERGGVSATARIRRILHDLMRVFEREPDGRGGTLRTDPLLQARLAEIEIETIALECTQLRILSRLSLGESVGDSAASLLKLKGSDLYQRATELAMHAVGLHALPEQPVWSADENAADLIGPEHATSATARYLNARARTIFGGTNEIQRTILARTVLESRRAME
jgi:alkylation response protein AidB-like acyl-CoA dehydrogenase